MRGMPKWINTKQDIQNLLQHKGLAEQTRRFLQDQIDNRFIWQATQKLEKTQDGEISEKKKIITQEIDGKTEQYQFELVEDPSARLFQLDMSVAEAEKLI